MLLVVSVIYPTIMFTHRLKLMSHIDLVQIRQLMQQMMTRMMLMTRRLKSVQLSRSPSVRAKLASRPIPRLPTVGTARLSHRAEGLSRRLMVIARDGRSQVMMMMMVTTPLWVKRLLCAWRWARCSLRTCITVLDQVCALMDLSRWR